MEIFAHTPTKNDRRFQIGSAAAIALGMGGFAARDAGVEESIEAFALPLGIAALFMVFAIGLVVRHRRDLR